MHECLYIKSAHKGSGDHSTLVPRPLKLIPVSSPPPLPQVVSIKESCYLQMERIRESYGGQTKHLKDLRDYSTQGLTTVKDQYLEQVRLLAYPQGNKTKAIA